MAPVAVKKDEAKGEEQKKSEPQVKFAEPVVQQESKSTPDKKAVDKVTAKIEAVKITEAQTFLKPGSYKVI